MTLSRRVYAAKISAWTPRLSRSEYQQRQLRRAIQPDRMNAAEPAADVEQRRRLEIQAAGVAIAVPARRDQRAEVRQPNLPAMIVAGEHEVEVVGLGPGELVGRMGEEDAEGRWIRSLDFGVADGDRAPFRTRAARFRREVTSAPLIESNSQRLPRSVKPQPVIAARSGATSGSRIS